MYIFKNALRCIGRSKGRNILIGIIVLVIAVSACIGLSIRQAAQSAKEETLSGMSVTATISLDRQSMMGNFSSMPNGGQGGRFDREQFAETFNSIESLSLEDYKKYAGASTVKDFYYTLTASLDGSDGIEPVSSDTSSDTADIQNPLGDIGKMGGGKGGMNMNSGDFSLTGYSSETAMTSFISGTASVTEGTVFTEGTDQYECIISDELATYNSLSVGSVITLTNPNAETETYQLTVVGIYTDGSTNDTFQRMPGSDPANSIYLSYTALNNIVETSKSVSVTTTDENSGREYETAVAGNLSATYSFANAEDYNTFETEVRTLGLGDDYTVSSMDITAFENSLVPLNTLSTMAGWFLLVILAIGAVILIVLNIFNIRERKYEIGVLTAIGMKKRNVALQFLTEIFVVTIISVFIGIGIGAVSAVPVTNALLENQISSAQNQTSKREQNFGRGDRGGMPDMNQDNAPTPPGGFGGVEKLFGANAANYVSEINSAMNFTVVLQMLGIAILLTVVSGAVSMLFVMRYEPLKILANRD